MEHAGVPQRRIRYDPWGPAQILNLPLFNFFFIVFLSVCIALCWFQPRLAAWVTLAAVFTLYLFAGLYLVHHLRENHRRDEILTISELCRKTNTATHKVLLFLCVSASFFCAGLHVHDALDSKPLSNFMFICSILLSLTGIFPTFNKSRDDTERRENAARQAASGTINDSIQIFDYNGETVAWVESNLSRYLHNLGVLFFVLGSIFFHFTNESLSPTMIGCLTTLVAAFVYALIFKDNASIFFEAAIVGIILCVNVWYALPHTHCEVCSHDHNHHGH